jgi:hypothetical protein
MRAGVCGIDTQGIDRPSNFGATAPCSSETMSPLVFYRTGTVRWLFDATERHELWPRLAPKARDDYDGNDGLRITEWKGEGGEPLLMFEQWC